MVQALRTIDDLEVEARRVLLRADFNVPLKHEASGAATVADDTRIRAALPTIEELRRRQARLVLVSHLGRPKDREPELSMRPVAERLAELVGAPATLAPAFVGPEVRALTQRLAPGQMLMLENVRYEPGETHNDPDLVASLAELADVYVNDAFGTAHRAHASTEGVAHRLPSAAGRLMQREVDALGAIVDHPKRPLVAILGGAPRPATRSAWSIGSSSWPMCCALVERWRFRFSPPRGTLWELRCARRRTSKRRAARSIPRPDPGGGWSCRGISSWPRASRPPRRRACWTASRSRTAGWASTSVGAPRSATRP
jgi:Phosphoglycerate kinase